MKRTKRTNRDNLRLWLVTVVVGFGIVLFAFVAVQQALRLGMNDPQLQIAQDTAAKLAQGATPAAVMPSEKVDESKSLATFVTIVDQNTKVLASSGQIDGQVPLPPASAFPDSQKRNNDWFTWEHDYGIRDAAVIVPFSGTHSGYVVVARSLSQAESTMNHIEDLAGITLLGILIAPTVIILLV